MNFFTHDNTHTHEFAGVCNCGWTLVIPWPVTINADLTTIA